MSDDKFPGLAVIPEGQTLYLHCDRCPDEWCVHEYGDDMTLDEVVRVARRHLAEHGTKGEK